MAYQLGDRVAFATNSHRTAHLRIGAIAGITPDGAYRIEYQVPGRTWKDGVRIDKALNRSIVLHARNIVKVAADA